MVSGATRTIAVPAYPLSWSDPWAVIEAVLGPHHGQA
jgi:hypothetical protein